MEKIINFYKSIPNQNKDDFLYHKGDGDILYHLAINTNITPNICDNIINIGDSNALNGLIENKNIAYNLKEKDNYRE